MDLKSWYSIEDEGLKLLKSWNIEKTGMATHAFSSRLGGVSQYPYNSLNNGLHVGDNSSHVIKNRSRMAAMMGHDVSSIVCAEQVHGNCVSVVRSTDMGRGSVDFSQSICGVDALITNVPGPVLTLFFADCVPVFFLDPVHKAIGLAHAGWKGTVAGVVHETLRAMATEFGTRPEDCLAAVGPSICRYCYEVSDDVAATIKEFTGDDRVLAHKSEVSHFADLKFANWVALQRSGVPTKSIAVSPHCTACADENFFSYRRDGNTGRMAAMISLKP